MGGVARRRPVPRPPPSRGGGVLRGARNGHRRMAGEDATTAGQGRHAHRHDLVSDLPGLDLAAFRRWYDGQRPGEVAGNLTGRLITGGKSNLTYEVTDGTSTWIVRRPPLGHVQATAHDMGREFAVMSALADTEVPVPRTFARCTDDSVLGAPFYVMERVDGTPYRSAAQLERSEERRVGKECRSRWSPYH